MLVIFDTNQKFMERLGYLFTYNCTSYLYIAYPYLIGALIFLPTIPIICFMYQHASEITEISEAMSLGAGVISALLKNGVMLYNRKRIAKLLVDLQHIVDGRMKSGQSQIYVTTNRITNLIIRICVALLVITLFPICLSPIGYDFLQEDEDKLWTQPLSMILPYETSAASIAFYITYGVCCISIIFAASTILCVACTFMGACMNVQAGLRDLCATIGDIENSTKNVSFWLCRYQDDVFQHRIRTSFIKCFVFHRKLIEIIHLISEIFSPIIFAQYFFSVMELCTLVFGLQMDSSSVSSFRKVINIMSAICFLAELMIYCYFGNELVLQTEKLSEAAYQTEWYRYQPKSRMLVWMMILRNQRPRYIRGLGLVDCSIETFVAVLNMIGSVLALLQNVA